MAHTPTVLQNIYQKMTISIQKLTIQWTVIQATFRHISEAIGFVTTRLNVYENRIQLTLLFVIFIILTQLFKSVYFIEAGVHCFRFTVRSFFYISNHCSIHFFSLKNIFSNRPSHFTEVFCYVYFNAASTITFISLYLSFL